MSTQVNFVCWSTADVTATIPTEAAIQSEEVLLATHSPLRITRRGGVTSKGTRLVSETEVLKEFLTATPNAGVIVATVLGESGAGKSHLVRWIHAKMRAEGDRADRRVIYLEKAETRFRDVVEKLLGDEQSPELDEIRRRMSSLGTGITLDEMEHKILAEMAEALRTATADSAYGRALVGENGLRLFFIDPLFERHLLRPGSFVERRARHALYGRGADEPEVPLTFTAAELPLDIGDYEDVKAAAAATQRLFRHLIANAQMQTEAVRLVNELLDVAVTRAASLNVGDLYQAFNTIRERLKGTEIVLLIEDVALIQGVRRDLLDAIVQPGVVNGVEKYATIRTMLAVTPSYYREQLPETFRRRAEPTSPIYEVDVELNAEADQEVLVDFVGRYLNAARVGKRALEAVSPDVPNKCTRCEFLTGCHEAFGASPSGYGLYPYNRAAVLRAVRACAEIDGERLLFNPRRVLARAIKDVLDDNISVIEEGRFPPAGLLSQEPGASRLAQLPTHVREKFESDYSEDDAARIETLVNFWGNAGMDDVHEGVLRAFSHPPLPALELGDQRGERTAGGEEGDRPRDGLPRSVQTQLDQIDRWSQGEVLPQAIADDMRKILREAILTRIDWSDFVIREPDSPTLAKAVPEGARGVSIEGARENIIRGVEPVLHVARSARNATTFKGLVLIKEGFPRRAGDALPRLDGIVNECLSVARKRIIAELEVDDDSLVAGAASLIRGAAACGVLPDRPKDIDYVNASLWQDLSPRRDADSRAPEWLTAYDEYLAARAPAVQRFTYGVGAAQGNGAVHAIDIQRLSKLIRRARDLANSDQEISAPSWCADANRRLKTLVRASRRQAEHWQTLLRRARGHLPEGTTWIETVDAITDAIRVGKDLGFVRVANLAAVAELNEAARSWNAASIVDVERLLSGVDAATSPEALSRVVGVQVGNDLPRITEYLQSSAQWIDAGLRLAEDPGDSPSDIATRLEATTRRWSEIVEDVMPND